MYKRIIVSGIAALALAGGAEVANARPGPNGYNTFGLCTAYHSGSPTGQENKRKAPPFQALEAAAEAEDMTVGEYCARYGQRPGGGGGAGGGGRGGRP